jgi:tripartite-type tricarboxylate transporter receptor subunit TctC
MKRDVVSVVLVGILSISLITGSVVAADFPSKPISILCISPPGGSHDIIARAFASVAEKFLGQPVVVVNRTAGGGVVATEEVIRSAPDGYTLFVDSTVTGSQIVWEIVNGRKPPFVLDDLMPLGSFTLSPGVVAVPYNSPWKTLDDMIRACKAKPDHFAFCSTGMYRGTQMPAEILINVTGISTRHVPMEGWAPCGNALVGEHVDFATPWPSASIPLIRGNKLRALAVLADRRLKFLPNIPTAKELGVDAEWYQWIGISAAKKTPSAIAEKLKDVAKKVAETKSFIDIIANQGDEVRFMNSDELAKFRVRELEKATKLVKQLIEQKK